MASSDTLAIFTALHNEPPTSTDAATLDVRNLHHVLDFDGSAAESAVFRSVMPRNYGGNGTTVYIHYAMSAAASGDIDWDAAWERIGDGVQNLDTDGFAAVNSVDTTTVPGTAGLVDIVNITFTDGADMASVAVGESYRLKITRDAPNDSATGDAELVAVEIKET